MSQTADTVLDLLASHRSIRRFKPDPVPDHHLRQAVQAGQTASTSSAVQAYSLIRVRDHDTLERLVHLTGGQHKVRHCGAFLVVCADSRRHRIACKLHNTQYEQTLEAFLVAVVDASLFAEKTVVALEAMGYGICYVGGLRNDLASVNELLRIPRGVYPLYGLCVGLPDESPSKRPRLPVDAVLADDRYPTDDAVLQSLERYDARYETYLAERGATPDRWSRIIAGKSKHPARADLAAVYRALGANLD